MVLSATVTFTNTDVIARTLSFESHCDRAYLLLGRDSTHFWGATDAVSGPNAHCSPLPVLDTVQSHGQIVYSDQHAVTDFTDFSRVLLPAGRYFVWVASYDSNIGMLFQVPFGWIAIDPKGP